MAEFFIRPIDKADRGWIAQFTEEHWGSDVMIVRGEVVFISQQEGFVAELEGQVVGLISYQVRGQACEITSLDSLREKQGIGSALIQQVVAAAREAGCRRLFLITTNDNLNALRFYQKRGFRLAAVYPGAVNEARKIKPQIPPFSEDGIPIQDELELEMDLGAE